MGLTRVMAEIENGRFRVFPIFSLVFELTSDYFEVVVSWLKQVLYWT